MYIYIICIYIICIYICNHIYTNVHILIYYILLYHIINAFFSIPGSGFCKTTPQHHQSAEGEQPATYAAARMLSRIDVGIQDRFIRCGTGTGKHHHSKQLFGQWKPMSPLIFDISHTWFSCTCLIFCGASNSIFHWIYTHSDFWWSCNAR